MGFINQLITGGPHIIYIYIYPLQILDSPDPEKKTTLIPTFPWSPCLFPQAGRSNLRTIMEASGVLLIDLEPWLFPCYVGHNMSGCKPGNHQTTIDFWLFGVQDTYTDPESQMTAS